MANPITEAERAHSGDGIVAETGRARHRRVGLRAGKVSALPTSLIAVAIRHPFATIGITRPEMNPLDPVASVAFESSSAPTYGNA
jgi:hypothetical protein